MATLFVMQGRDRGKRFDLRSNSLTVGRDATNGIQLNDSEVSRRHAEVRRTSEGLLVADLASSNGTFVNTEKVEQQRLLQNGDRLQIGRTLLLFTDADDRTEETLAHDVDILPLSEVEGSRILKSVPHESGSQIFPVPDSADSPWLARARSNLQVMYRTALAVSHTLDIDELLHRIMERERAGAERHAVRLALRRMAGVPQLDERQVRR